MKQLQLDIKVTRGPLTESLHSTYGVAVDARGTVLATAGDTRFVTYWRSCAKPFQVMPLIESDAFDSLGWDARQLAIACGSHGGEPEHVSLAESMLADAGLEEGDLACGAHEPLSARGLRALRDSGELPSRLHNNCSGKHAAMLARAVTAGWAYAGYEQDDHKVQLSIREMVSRWTGVPSASIIRGIDGCGAVVFALPLDAMALAYARLGAAAEKGEEIPARVVDAIREHPFLLGGSERFDTVLLEETNGRVVAKVGAEGVYCFCVPELGIGGALKVTDGAQRAQHVALLQMLVAMEIIPPQLSPRLDEFMHRPIRNTRGDVVGTVSPA